MKPGTLDDKDAIDSGKPVQEIFTIDRPNWYDAISGVKQVEVQ